MDMGKDRYKRVLLCVMVLLLFSMGILVGQSLGGCNDQETMSAVTVEVGNPIIDEQERFRATNYENLTDDERRLYDEAIVVEDGDPYVDRRATMVTVEGDTAFEDVERVREGNLVRNVTVVKRGVVAPIL